MARSLFLATTILLLGGMMPLVALQDYARPDLLVSTEWLELHIDDPTVRIVDTRTPRGGYEKSHIPGAVYLDIGTSRDADNPPSYLPELNLFAEQLSAIGIDSETHVVFYDDRGGIYGTRPWVVLQVLGHARASILNGGWDKWIHEARPVSSEVPSALRREYTLPDRPATRSWIATSEDVQTARVDGLSQIIDARNAAEVNGVDSGNNPRGGAIPGAIPIFWEGVLSAELNTIRPASELRELFETHGVDLERPVITYCQGAGRAAHELFVLRLMGHDDLKLYMGSWEDWSRDPSLPAETWLAVRRDIDSRISMEDGADVSVVVRRLDSRTSLELRPATRYHAASTMKIPVMIELFNRVEAGELSLSDPLPIGVSFHSIVDGSRYELTSDEDSEKSLYQRVGDTLSLGELNEAMITLSSNLATNLLMTRLGVKRIQQTLTALGADGMQVLRGVEDIKAFRAGQSNTTDADALSRLLLAIGNARGVSDQASSAMIEILKRQRFREGIPAGLPDNIEVAHKTGNITEIHHDAGIVFANNPYVLVVLVRGIADAKRSGRLIADISERVYRMIDKAE